MLAGLFVRHYKIYKNINFIPISTGSGFSSFLGANGIGKSSILDALDKFFNGGDWSINALAKSEGGLSTEDKLPYIVPVFCIPKEELPDKCKETVELLSSYLWGTKIKTTDSLSAFYDLREALQKSSFSKDTHFLIAIGKQYGRSNAYLGSFDKDPDLRTTLDLFDINQRQLDDLLTTIVNHYSYLYIPVEADPTTFSKLESTHIQKLMDEDIRSKIQTAISQKTINTINTSLQSFITDISSSLKNYKYKGTFKDKLTMNDLVEKVFEAYFTIKVLHKTNGSSSIPIRDLSAGEKRRALIDLAYSLLARSANRSQRLILAIDEPDASLHVAACHDQFSRLAEIPNLTQPQSQLLITTHWYGFLPIIQNGVAHALSEGKERIEFFSFNLQNFREQIRQAAKSSRGEQPRDVELKSYNDMVQSIVSSMVRTPSYNWILCEGLSDKIYLDFYLEDLVKNHNLRIIPLGGFKEVRRAYTYLKTPLGDPEYRILGKVLCIVDTDSMLEHVDSKPDNKSIDFQRIIYDTVTSNVILVKIDHQLTAPATEIEHSLDPIRFLTTVQSLPNENGGSELKRIVNEAKHVASEKNVYSYLNLAPSENKLMMESYFDVGDNKVDFAKRYVTVDAQQSSTPEWILSLRTYFTPEGKRIKKN